MNRDVEEAVRHLINRAHRWPFLSHEEAVDIVAAFEVLGPAAGRAGHDPMVSELRDRVTSHG